MMRWLVALSLLAFGAGCGTKAPPVALEREATTCPVACGSVDVVGPLVKLTPVSRAFPYFLRLARMSTGWAVAWHSDIDAHSYVQRMDEDGVPAGQALSLPDAQGVELHWDGTSLALWADIYPTNESDRSKPAQRAYARFDATLEPLETATLLGPNLDAATAAYDFEGAQALAALEPWLGLRVSALSMAPGLELTSNQHFLSRAPRSPWSRVGLAWTGKELAAAYFTGTGYELTFVDPATLAETRTVELGEATGETPQAIELAVGETLLWVAVWEMSSQHLWLRAVDLASGEPALEPMLFTWPSTLQLFTTAGDTPVAVGAPPRPVEPENTVIYPIDPQTKSICTGTRLGTGDVEAIELHGAEGAALLDVNQSELYFARIHCSEAP